MKSGAAIAVILALLPLPMFAQRGSSHGGSFGNRGYGGHSTYFGNSGFIGHRGASEPGGYAPAPPFRYGSIGPPPAVRYDPPHISASHIGVGQNGLLTSPAYRAEFNGRRTWDGNRNGGWDHRWGHEGNHDRDRFRGRARSFENWYLFSSPGWVQYGYPYVVDPGFYDWSDYDNTGSDQNNEASGYNNEGPDNQPGNPNGEFGEHANGSVDEGSGEQPPPWPEPGASQTAPENHFSVSGLSAASAPPLEGPLTVYFKNGRAPEEMQNFMLTAKALTDLDADHYEQIPLDQIDMDETTRANRASGLEFRVPGASRD